MGVPTLKSVLDAWIYQEILAEVRPDTIVELGSWAGGSTLYLAHLCDALGHGRVVSVDHDRSAWRVSHPRIAVVTGDTASPETHDAVRELIGDGRALVIHDAGHHAATVRRDLEAFAPLVAVGSYLIVEDGVVDLFEPGRGISDRTTPGPLVATRAFLAEHPEFVSDKSRERYWVTYNPDGYLKRVR